MRIARSTAISARLGLRRARGTVRGVFRPAADWRRPLGPVQLTTGTLELRAPRLADGPAWRVQRLRQQERVRKYWPVTGSWEQAHTMLSWAEYVVRHRFAARRGLARPHVSLLDGRLFGQFGVDAIDRGSDTGELSLWGSAGWHGHVASRVGTAMVCLDAFTCVNPVARLVAPVAAENAGPSLIFASLGFQPEAVLRSYRPTGSGRSDHTIWVLHRSRDAIARLRAVIADGTVPAGVARPTMTGTPPVGSIPDRWRLTVPIAQVLVRLGVRMVRSAIRTRLAPATDWQLPLGPVRVAGSELLLRPPALGDADQWVVLRLRNQRRLQSWFPVARSWADGNTPLHWAEICHHSRAAARRGAARPRVVLIDGRMRGQWGVDAVDLGTSSGELSFWLDSGTGGHELSRAVCAMVCLDAFTCAAPLERLVAPVPVDNRAASATLQGAGFTAEGTLRQYRVAESVRADHWMWVLHRSPETIAALRALVAGESLDVPALQLPAQWQD